MFTQAPMLNKQKTPQFQRPKCSGLKNFKKNFGGGLGLEFFFKSLIVQFFQLNTFFYLHYWGAIIAEH